VLTPSLDQAPWLPDNLRSVACQTYADIEHVVVDGGSTDGSLAILAAAGGAVTWESGTDAGQADAINRAFARSTGEIIGWLNSDDAYFDRHVVTEAVAFLAAHPDVDVAYGHCVQITGEGMVIQMLWAPPFDLEVWKSCNPQMQPATFVRRRALSEPMLDDSFHFALDYELWLRLATQRRRFGRIDRILAVDRHQLGRKSATIKDVNAADLKRLQPMYDLHLGPEFDAQRTSFYRRQRLMGALLIPRVRADRVAFTPSPQFKQGLWRRQIGSRRSDWPEELR